MNKTILKWAGNKTKIMSQITNYFPESFTNYVEPFAGALGSFLNANIDIENHDVFLNDANSEIIDLFISLRDNAEDIVRLANSFRRDKESYYEIRSWDRDENWNMRSQIEKCARTLYLNKLCFNGLYRINPKKGYFNTPYGTFRKNDLLTLEEANSFIEKTENVNFSNLSYDELCKLNFCKNSLFYFDPPYVNKKDPKKEFGGYIGSFGWEEQVKLRDLGKTLFENGHNVIISNTYCDETLELYKDYRIESLFAPRSISRNASGRKKAKEILAILKN